MEEYLLKIIDLAKKSLETNDVPIGAIIVKNGEIIGEGFNTRERDQNIMGHAEINAIKAATKKIGNWNLKGSTMYVTLKPCTMCWNIIKEARIDFVYYILDKPENKLEYNKTIFQQCKSVNVEENYLQILKDFFEKLRKK